MVNLSLSVSNDYETGETMMRLTQIDCFLNLGNN